MWNTSAIPIQQNKSTHMITFTKKNLYEKCIPCFFLNNDDGRIVALNFLAD